ncbi:aldolase [Rhodoplanes roseus]|uniref:Aldolase n=2 Tax=Rhodoplanes roseus TaxID=29409 RepID=A0A327KIP5_9BRAD|nr:aldolase [Rhodoplanes roseus]
MPRGGLKVGTFVKTASPQVIEVLGQSRLDFAVVDAEHAPFDRLTLDLMMTASCAVGLPLAVRIPEVSAPVILSTLDIGAAGLLVPHVDTAQVARDVIAMTRHRGGVRGFSGSPRFAGYGTLSMAKSLDAGEGAFVMCQIESAEAVENAAAIAAVDGVDGLFIGYADLALSMGLESPQDPRVTAAAERVIETGRAAGKTVGMFVSNAAERDRFAARGVEWIVVSSDQSLLRLAADALVPAR